MGFWTWPVKKIVKSSWKIMQKWSKWPFKFLHKIKYVVKTSTKQRTPFLINKTDCIFSQPDAAQRAVLTAAVLKLATKATGPVAGSWPPEQLLALFAIINIKKKPLYTYQKMGTYQSAPSVWYVRLVCGIERIGQCKNTFVHAVA